MIDIVFNAITYKISKMPAIKQFHILRRLATVFKGVPTETVGTSGDQGNLKILSVILDGIGTLPDADADYVLYGLLTYVTRRHDGGTGWAPIVSGTSLMYNDIDLKTLMLLAFEVLKVNFSDFFRGLPSAESTTV